MDHASGQLAMGLWRPEALLPAAILLLALMLWGYRVWTRPAIAGAIGIGALALAGLSMVNENVRARLLRGDNIAIALLLVSLAFFLWLALRRAAVNDLGGGDIEDARVKILTWPDLVYIELICMIFATTALIVWSILAKAPLEQPANPAAAPNPAKAPWYFVGLQELLVYFDPWIAGVLYSTLIVLGLAAIPYLDRNPAGGGRCTLAQRPAAISIFLFGFLILWVLPIVIGTFLRGPNWSLFSPAERWDIHRYDAMRTINFSDLVWQRWLGRGRPGNWAMRESAPLLLMALYFIGVPVLLGARCAGRCARGSGGGGLPSSWRC